MTSLSSLQLSLHQPQRLPGWEDSFSVLFGGQHKLLSVELRLSYPSSRHLERIPCLRQYHQKELIVAPIDQDDRVICLVLILQDVSGLHFSSCWAIRAGDACPLRRSTRSFEAQGTKATTLKFISAKSKTLATGGNATAWFTRRLVRQLYSFRELFGGSPIRQRMPGELLPTMAAPGVSKAKLSRAKADLYLIVSKLSHCPHFVWRVNSS